VSTVAFTADALGTTVRVVATQPSALGALAGLTSSGLGQLDAAASRFRDDSEISRANVAAGNPVRVGPLLRDAVQACLDMACATAGIVDPTVGACVVAAGYDGRFADYDPMQVRVIDAGWLTAHDQRRATWRDVVLDPDDCGAWLTIPAGTALDLGAVAKAWMADRLALAAESVTVGGVVVDLGGDLRAAGPTPDGGWLIGLPAGADGQRIVSIREGGMATSAQDERRWMTTEGPAHHIIDPRSGRPAVSPWRAVTVHAATAMEANAASTAAIVLGHAAPDWLSRHGLAARLVPMDSSPVTTVGAWPRSALVEA
jgi:thiamine biosynthesis lipoprotein